MASDLITTDLVALDADFGDSVDSVITNLATLVHDTGRATDIAGLAQPAIDREAKAGTGVPGGVAIPHCRSEAVTEPTLAFARLSRGVDFSGPDGDAQLVFLIAAPAGGGKAHLKILSKLARALVRKDFLESLRNAPTKEEIVRLVLDVVNAEKPKKKPAEEPATQGSAAGAATTGAAAAAPPPPRPRPKPLPAQSLRPMSPASWPSPPAPPASPTLTWRPTPSPKPQPSVMMYL